MAEEELINQETPSADGSAEDELLSTSEASKLANVSARTLKRRADIGILRRSSVHTQFGIETRYYKKELEKLKQEMQEKRADAIAEISAELQDRRADGAELQVAGGDRKSISGAELAELSSVIDQKITKITEPFFKLSDTIESGFDRLLALQEKFVKSQAQILELEINRDREKEKEGERDRKKGREESLKTRIIIMSYILVMLATLGIFGYLFWLMYSGKLFDW